MMSIILFRIHIETTSVLLKQLPVQYLKRPTNWNYAPYSTGIVQNVTHSNISYQFMQAICITHITNIALDSSTCPSNNFIQVPSGKVALGKPVDSSGYGWDIDYGRTDME